MFYISIFSPQLNDTSAQKLLEDEKYKGFSIFVLYNPLQHHTNELLCFAKCRTLRVMRQSWYRLKVKKVARFFQAVFSSIEFLNPCYCNYNVVYLGFGKRGGSNTMKKEYNFSKGIRGKFYRANKVQKTIRIDQDVLDFYQKLAEENGIPYQTLINLTLKKFAAEDGEITIKPR